MKKKVILQNYVPNLGVAGDIKSVSPGYARNYLIPQGIAVPATARTLKVWNDRKEELEKAREEKLAAAREQAGKIKELVCVLNVRAGKDEKLFGSVTTSDVSRFFNEQGFAIDRRWIELREPIRTIGEFQGSVRFHPEVRATFKIQVNPLA